MYKMEIPLNLKSGLLGEINNTYKNTYYIVSTQMLATVLNIGLCSLSNLPAQGHMANTWQTGIKT